MTRILLVEDEESYRMPLVYQLTKEGYEVSAWERGDEGLEAFSTQHFDAAILDLMIPGIDGMELARRIRQQSWIPIIMVTAKSAEVDKIVGLEMGADDYITKPYSFRELLARLRAVLRRHEHEEAAPARGGATAALPLTAGTIELFGDEHKVTIGGKEVFFPLKEFELLQYLMSNVGRVLRRQQLIDHVWGADYVGDTKTLDVHIKRVRAKIEENPADPHFITTIRGLGYRFNIPQ
jgi:two-component system response regulator RegX3